MITAIFSMLMEIISQGVQVPRTVNLRQWRRLCTGAGNLSRFYFVCVRMGVYEEGSCEYVCSRVRLCICLFVSDSVYAGVRV